MEQDSIFDLQSSLLFYSNSLLVVMSRGTILSSEGLVDRVMCRYSMSSRTCWVRPGVNFGIFLIGMLCLEA